MAVLAPIPTARVVTATAVKPGLLPSRRKPTRRLRSSPLMVSIHFTRAQKPPTRSRKPNRKSCHCVTVDPFLFVYSCSLLPQRLHGIEFRGAASRDVAARQNHGEHDPGDDGERRPVPRAHSVEQARHETG